MTKIEALVAALVLAGLTFGGLAPARAAEERDDGTQVGVKAPAPTVATALARRALVTFFKSRTDAPRSTTAVTVVNSSSSSCQVQVKWYLQGSNTAVCSSSTSLAPGFAQDFCSRDIPGGLTTCNNTCSPELTFAEGKAIVLSSNISACGNIAVDPRVYYTNGDTSDDGVAAISNSRVVH